MSNVYFYAIVASAQFVKERNPQNEFFFGQDIFSAVIRQKETPLYQELPFLPHHSNKLHLNIFLGRHFFKSGKISTGGKDVCIHENKFGIVFAREYI